ncbi:hypothetical protein RvY_18640 [Ramazzottius varieornatus]|uniref:Uncharacterized protein n=1 Tax=Ramazzottius varieornatus TaxID=947166 RepID=A0A1D1W6S3_RAMVA|nr:hypothetical protein RvY_18640 [Ramazzottius varieornatus]
MAKASSGRKGEARSTPDAGKKSGKSKRAVHKSKVKPPRPDYSKPVWWRKEDVSKPQDWYERAYGENFFPPNSSTTDIYGQKQRKRTVAFARGCFLETDDEGGRSSPDSDNAKSISEEPVEDDEIPRDESSSEDADEKRGTVLKSLTEEEAQKIADYHLKILREEYACDVEKYSAPSTPDNSCSTSQDEWEKAMRKRLDEQRTRNEVADAKSSIISNALLAERHHKLEGFARSSKSRCLDKPALSPIGWSELLEKKQKYAEDKLSTYRSWTPWAVTSYWMRAQIDKVTRSNMAEKRDRLANLTSLRTSHETLKAKWTAEHNLRHEILQSAIKKENSEHVTDYVHSRLRRIEPLKAQKGALLHEFEKWQEIKERWYVILQTKLSRRHDLHLQIRALRPQTSHLSRVEVPIGDATTHSLVKREGVVKDELRELQRNLQDQYTYYNIESVFRDKVVEAHSFFHDDEKEEESGEGGTKQKAQPFASLPSMERSVEFSEVLEHAFSFSET